MKEKKRNQQTCLIFLNRHKKNETPQNVFFYCAIKDPKIVGLWEECCWNPFVRFFHGSLFYSSSFVVAVVVLLSRSQISFKWRCWQTHVITANDLFCLFIKQDGRSNVRSANCLRHASTRICMSKVTERWKGHCRCWSRANFGCSQCWMVKIWPLDYPNYPIMWVGFT